MNFSQATEKMVRRYRSRRRCRNCIYRKLPMIYGKRYYGDYKKYYKPTLKIYSRPKKVIKIIMAQQDIEMETIHKNIAIPYNFSNETQSIPIN